MAWFIPCVVFFLIACCFKHMWFNTFFTGLFITFLGLRLKLVDSVKAGKTLKRRIFLLKIFDISIFAGGILVFVGLGLVVLPELTGYHQMLNDVPLRIAIVLSAIGAGISLFWLFFLKATDG